MGSEMCIRDRCMEASAASSKRKVCEGIAFGLLALGCGIKLLPVIALPFFLRHARHPILGLFSFAVVLLAPLAGLFALDEGPVGLGAGLGQYALRWESFSMLFRFIEGPIRALLSSVSDPRLIARGTIGVLFLIAGYRQWRLGTKPLEAARFSVAVFLVLTPTLHPWYLLWLLPLLAFRPTPAWILFFAMAPLLYWPLTEWRALEEWREPAWLWPLMMIPFVCVLLAERLYLSRLSSSLPMPLDRD